MQRMTKTVRTLIIATFVAYLFQIAIMATGGENLVYDQLALSLRGVLQLKLWQPLSYMFLHDPGSILHIIFNMLGLYFLGCSVEDALGERRFAKLYFGCGIIAALGWIIISYLRGTAFSTCIGASGAVAGIVGAFAGMYPNRQITLLVFFILPVTMKARTMALGMVIIALYMMYRNTGNVAHSAHLFGCIAGYIYGHVVASNPTMLRAEGYGRQRGFSLSSIFSNLRAKIRRKQMRVIRTSEKEGDGLPTEDEVNRILDKIKKKGKESLTRKERDILMEASRRGD